MEKVAIVGTGLVGRGWAIVFARAGWQVTLYDADLAAVEVAQRVIAERLVDLERNGLLAESETVYQRISSALNLADAVQGAVHVQESIRETVEAKRQIFAELDKLAAPDTVLCSSSSAIAASAFTEQLQGRGRCLIGHPVNPPYLIPLVELCPSPWTDPEVLKKTRERMQAVGQVPILIKREIQGFVLNRLQGAVLNEAYRLVAEGCADPDDVDKAVRDGLGLRWSFIGPFETIDLNAPGGVVDYAARYAQMYFEMAQTQRDSQLLGGPLLETIETARRELLAETELADRQAWRDRRLMALLAHKADAERKIHWESAPELFPTRPKMR